MKGIAQYLEENPNIAFKIISNNNQIIDIIKIDKTDNKQVADNAINDIQLKQFNENINDFNKTSFTNKPHTEFISQLNESIENSKEASFNKELAEKNKTIVNNFQNVDGLKSKVDNYFQDENRNSLNYINKPNVLTLDKDTDFSKFDEKTINKINEVGIEYDQTGKENFYKNKNNLAYKKDIRNISSFKDYFNNYTKTLVKTKENQLKTYNDLNKVDTDPRTGKKKRPNTIKVKLNKNREIESIRIGERNPDKKGKSLGNTGRFMFNVFSIVMGAPLKNDDGTIPLNQFSLLIKRSFLRDDNNNDEMECDTVSDLQNFIHSIIYQNKENAPANLSKVNSWLRDSGFSMPINEYNETNYQLEKSKETGKSYGFENTNLTRDQVINLEKIANGEKIINEPVEETKSFSQYVNKSSEETNDNTYDEEHDYQFDNSNKLSDYSDLDLDQSLEEFENEYVEQNKLDKDQLDSFQDEKELHSLVKNEIEDNVLDYKETTKEIALNLNNPNYDLDEGLNELKQSSERMSHGSLEVLNKEGLFENKGVVIDYSIKDELSLQNEVGKVSEKFIANIDKVSELDNVISKQLIVKENDNRENINQIGENKRETESLVSKFEQKGERENDFGLSRENKTIPGEIRILDKSNSELQRQNPERELGKNDNQEIGTESKISKGRDPVLSKQSGISEEKDRTNQYGNNVSRGEIIEIVMENGRGLVGINFSDKKNVDLEKLNVLKENPNKAVVYMSADKFSKFCNDMATKDMNIKSLSLKDQSKLIDQRDKLFNLKTDKSHLNNRIKNQEVQVIEETTITKKTTGLSR